MKPSIIKKQLKKKEKSKCLKNIRVSQMPYLVRHPKYNRGYAVVLL